jgi:hypothetical protein
MLAGDDIAMVALMVPPIEALVPAAIDTLATSGSITLSYVEQFTLGAVGQLS